MKLANLRIGTQLITGFAVVIVTMNLVFGFALFSFWKMQQADELNREAAAKQEVGQTLLLGVVNMETGLRGFVGSGKEPFLQPYQSGRQQFDEAMKQAQALTASDAAQRKRLDAMLASEGQFLKVAENLIKMRRDATQLMSGTEDLVAAFSRGEDMQATNAFREQVGAFVKAEATVMESRSSQVRSLRDLTRNTLTGGSLFVLLFGSLVAFGLRRSISKPLAHAVEASRRVAAGDLTVSFDLDRKDEIGALLESLQQMQQSLTVTVGHVRDNAESVATASVQIAHGNTELSRRTEQQAAALQQAAASMDHINGTVSQNAQSAHQASRLAVGASEVAAKGGEVVSQVVDTMKGINDSSKKISEIIGVIDGIAFQTNILALNAAVEAARAGEQGRGFAVVAGEVRTLAQRSADAAKEIKSLIGVSVERVEQGSALVDRAGATMSEIVGAIQRVSQIVSEISAASSEQNSGIQQVSTAVRAMDQATQQNAALVEESAAAAESLSSQAAQLVETVAVFRLRPTPA
jgi:methyl-accepting chemotaxis protein